jgi:O-antigen/teichoic acid export membrane protein
LEFNNLKQLSFIGGADVVGSAITAIFWFFLASQISPDEYGQIFYFIGIASIAGAFVIVGAQNSILVYSAKNIKIESTLYLLSLIFAVIASFIIIIIFYKVDVVFLVFGYVINTLALGQLLGKKLFSSYSKFSIIQKILTFGLGIIFLLSFGAEGIILALSLSYVCFIVVAYKTFRNTKINFSLLKDRTKFIFNNYVIEVLTKLNVHVNKFLIVPILGFGILGEFSLAQQLVNVGMVFTLIVFKFTLPHDSQGEENKKLKKYAIFISIGISILGFFVAPLIIPIFFSEYSAIVDTVRIISFCIIPMTFTKIFTSKLLGQENSKRVLYSKIVSIITFLGIISIFSFEYGLIALAIGYLASTITETLCLLPKINSGKINNS